MRYPLHDSGDSWQRQIWPWSFISWPTISLRLSSVLPLPVPLSGNVERIGLAISRRARCLLMQIDGRRRPKKKKKQSRVDVATPSVPPSSHWLIFCGTCPSITVPHQERRAIAHSQRCRVAYPSYVYISCGALFWSCQSLFVCQARQTGIDAAGSGETPSGRSSS